MANNEGGSGCPAELAMFCSRRHWAIYWLLIVLALTPVAWRTSHVINHGVAGDSPMFSANDRSRWCQVASLVEHGEWEIDRVINLRGEVQWDTIDKVRHLGRDGQFHFYSSKPPLLSTIIAGEYLLLKYVTGWELTREPLPVVRTLLTINHVICLAILMALLASFLEPMFVSDWTRYFVMAAAGWGTFLTTFAVTLNNHLPAATTAMATIWLADLIVRQPGKNVWSRCFWLGLWAATTVAFELPAAALFGIVALVVSIRAWRGLATFLPAAALVGAVIVGLNFWAHNTWRPAYSFRNDGEVIATFSGDYSAELNSPQIPGVFRNAIEGQMPNTFLPEKNLDRMKVEPGTWMGDSPNIRWVVVDSDGNGLFAIRNATDDKWTLHRWGNWYDHPGSYWNGTEDRRSKVDRGEPDPMKYAFHFFVGHHGVLLLTPLWLLAFAGMFPLATSRVLDRRWLGMAGLAITFVVIAFYLLMPEHNRNYGGWTSGPRWLFWLIPLWLICMVPVVQMLARWRWGQAICLVFLAASVLSGMYSLDNPWAHPWLYQLWHWIDPSFAA